MANQLSNPSDDPYERFRVKLLLHMKNELFNEELLSEMKGNYAQLLQREPIVFTRYEKKRVLQDVLREIFDDILAQV